MVENDKCIYWMIRLCQMIFKNSKPIIFKRKKHLKLCFWKYPRTTIAKLNKLNELFGDRQALGDF